MTESNLVLHGIWNSGHWVRPLAARLRRRGVAARAWGYPSVVGGPEVALPALAACVRAQQVRALVGYSLGGLLALELLRREPDLGIERVVCLGSPLCGSQTARWLQGHRLGWVLGRSGPLLVAGQAGLPATVAIGQVAGCRAMGVGRLLGAQGQASDGTVGLAETRWPGLADHCVVEATHTGLPFHQAAADQIAHLLHTGQFARP